MNEWSGIVGGIVNVSIVANILGKILNSRRANIYGMEEVDVRVRHAGIDIGTEETRWRPYSDSCPAETTRINYWIILAKKTYWIDRAATASMKHLLIDADFISVSNS